MKPENLGARMLLACVTAVGVCGTGPVARAAPSEVSLGEFGPGSVFITGEGLAATPMEQWYTPTPSHGVQAANAYAFAQNVVRLGIGYHSDFGVSAYVQAIGTTLLNLPTNAIAPYPQGQSGIGATYFAANGHRDGAAVFIKQAFVALDPAKFGGFGFVGGRYEFNDGTEILPDDPGLRWLVLSRIEQRLVGSRYVLVGGRSFDGAKASYGNADYNVTML